jgi:YegS/Rv2252/BmrU family lipid kinase
VNGRRAVFLVNPASKNGSTGRRWPGLYRRAQALGLEGDVLLSQRPGHLTELAREAAGPDTLLVVVGGDGTLNEVVNGIAGLDAELAVLPAGTGQDFGKTHGIPDAFDDAVRVALEGEARPVDLGRVSFRDGADGEAERWFANVGSAGMSGAVAHRANSMSKRLGGRATFFWALLREFAAWKNTEVTVTLDGAERRGAMHDVIVANGRWHGGGMKLAPDARADDGLFDVVLIGDVTKLDFVTTAPKLYSGKHVTHPRVEVLRSATVAVDAAKPLPIELEGEQVGTTPARFEVVPGALRVRMPSKPSG